MVIVTLVIAHPLAIVVVTIQLAGDDTKIRAGARKGLEKTQVAAGNRCRARGHTWQGVVPHMVPHNSRGSHATC